MPRPQITHSHPYAFKKGALAGRTFSSEHAYRAALARMQGPKRVRGIRSRSSYAALRPASRIARERALDALSRMRRQKLSLTHAARVAGTTVHNVVRHAGSALKRNSEGRYVASKSDRLYRSLLMVTTEGPRTVETSTSGAASLIGKHHSAMRHFLTTGDPRRVRQFEGKHVIDRGKRYYFLTDLDEIERLGRAGEFSFESLYEHAA